MNEVRALLEGVQRQVRARPGSLDRVLLRHRRRQRGQRVAAGLVALAVAAAGMFVATRALRFGDRQLAIPASPVIGSTNVFALAPAWSTPVPGLDSAASPAASDGAVYVSSDDGRLYAFDGRTGSIRWVGRTKGGVLSRPEVAGSQVFVQGAGTLYAFEAACGSGGATCSPDWTAATGSDTSAPPAVAAGTVYVTTDRGTLLAFDASCAGHEVCEPIWTADDDGHLALAPSVVDGVVWDTSGEALLAFPASCLPQESPCEALMSAFRPHGARISSEPEVGEEIVYVGASNGSLFALPTECANGGACEPLWIGRTDGAIVDKPLADADQVYVGSNDGRLYAFPASCRSDGGTCAPVWIGRTDGAVDEPAVVGNGIVYVVSTDGRFYAFPRVCDALGRTCPPLLDEAVGALPSPPAVWADRVLFLASADGTLTAYTVGGAEI